MNVKIFVFFSFVPYSFDEKEQKLAERQLLKAKYHKNGDNDIGVNPKWLSLNSVNLLTIFFVKSESRTHYLLHKGERWYDSAMEMQVTERIFNLTPIHVSMIY